MQALILRQTLSAWRQQGETIAFVPTMGNLHAGHLQLVRRAQALARRVVVSIFVNPLQFEPGSDYERYPRTLAQDQQALQALGVDIIWAPAVETLYPGGLTGLTAVTKVIVPGLSDILCGHFRPGHFIGVTTVVCKLLHQVQPDFLLLGEKDYQQLVLIRQMVRDLDIPVQVVSQATMREADGLAMSSRNQYLTLQERAVAPQLYLTLCALAQSQTCFGPDIQAACHQLAQAGFRVEYLECRDAQTLQYPTAATQQRILLVAAWLGQTRLIDNYLLDDSSIRKA